MSREDDKNIQRQELARRREAKRLERERQIKKLKIMLAICVVSFVLIVGAFVLFDRSGVVTMLASLVGLFSCFREKKSTEKKKYKGDTFALD